MQGPAHTLAEAAETLVLRTAADLQSLREPWERLFEESPTASPPLRWQWVWNWWRVFGADRHRELQVIVVQREGRIVGILPLYRTRTALARRLTFISAGLAEFEETCAEDLNLLHAAGEDAHCVRAVARRLWSNRANWDELELNDLPRHSPLLELVEFFPWPWNVTVQTCGECFAADLSNGFEPYVQGLSSKARAEARRLLRQAEQPGLRFHVASDAPTAETFFDQLVCLHHQRWQSVGRSGSFAPRHAEFHRSLAVALVPQGQVLLARLSSAQEPLAMVIAHRVGQKLDVYQQGALRTTAPLRSPGTLANLLLMREAITRGIRCVDQLKGANDLKDRYFRVRRPLMRVLVRQPNWRTGSLLLARYAGGATRRTLHLLRSGYRRAEPRAVGASDAR